jgi:hypothetical protein
MSRFTRAELEQAFDHYQEVNTRSMATQDWSAWANQFTEDAVYMEHAFGEMRGRETIRAWITEAMKSPGWDQATFEPEWRMIDEEKGWIVISFLNKMPDLGDGVVRQAVNFSLIKYAGDNQWSYQEDIYNPMEMAKLTTDWFAAKAASEG